MLLNVSEGLFLEGVVELEFLAGVDFLSTATGTGRFAPLDLSVVELVMEVGVVALYSATKFDVACCVVVFEVHVDVTKFFDMSCIDGV